MYSHTNSLIGRRTCQRGDQKRPQSSLSISSVKSSSFALEPMRTDMVAVQAPPLLAINVTKDHQ